MLALLCFVLAVLASPFKLKRWLVAENAAGGAADQMTRKILIAVALALVAQALAAWTGFKILTITIDEPFKDWYPYEVTNTSDLAVCFSYRACSDDGKPDERGYIADDHKQVCETKEARLEAGQSLNPDQTYAPPLISDVRTCGE